MADATSVISLLGQGALHLLSVEHVGTQQFVLDTIAACINQWEAKTVVLDPITREAVLDSLVVIHIAAAKGFAQMVIDARQEHDASCDR